jgi:hypothetical protein
LTQERVKPNEGRFPDQLRLATGAGAFLRARSLYLFGSTARSGARPDIDVDLFVGAYATAARPSSWCACGIICQAYFALSSASTAINIF